VVVCVWWCSCRVVVCLTCFSCYRHGGGKGGDGTYVSTLYQSYAKANDTSTKKHTTKRHPTKAAAFCVYSVFLSYTDTAAARATMAPTPRVFTSLPELRQSNRHIHRETYHKTTPHKGRLFLSFFLFFVFYRHGGGKGGDGTYVSSLYQSYVKANDAFAEAVHRAARAGDMVWCVQF